MVEDDKAVASTEKKEEGLFRYRKKIMIAKLIFGVGIGAVGIAAGFKFGYTRSAKKHGISDHSAAKAAGEDPVQFASRALRRATLITLGCFAVGITAVSLAFGITSRADLKNISRRKWIKEREEQAKLDAQAEFEPVSSSTQLSINNVPASSLEQDRVDDYIVPTEDVMTTSPSPSPQPDLYQIPDGETIVDTAEVLTDKWK